MFYISKTGGTFSQAIPVVMPSSVITSAQQQNFAFQNHIPVMQPGFSPPRPISVPGSNGFYGTKFSWNCHSDSCVIFPELKLVFLCHFFNYVLNFLTSFIYFPSLGEKCIVVLWWFFRNLGLYFFRRNFVSPHVKENGF